ncbi:MAG TPA: DUF2314 domain-containing protein [Ideonella sp.]|nr:DUF2314 domain-containing protein [Ideonella sp.]
MNFHLPRALLRAALAFVLLGTSLHCGAQESTPIPDGRQIAASIKYQFAIYYLGQPAKPPLQALQSQIKALPHPLKLVSGVSEKPNAPLVAATLEKNVQSAYAPPGLDMLQRFGRGLTRDQAVAMQSSEQALILDFAHPASFSFTAYRSALTLTEQVARDTSGLIWDEETREVFSPEEWHKRRLDTWDGDIPNALMHTVIHAYKGDRLVRAITLGMAKFGLPDVVVDDFSWSENRPMGNLINLLSQALVEGAVVGPRGSYDLDIHQVKHAAVRRSHLDTLKPNTTAIAKLVLVTGIPDEGDPHNRLVEIRFDRTAGPDRHAQQAALLSSLFGSEDAIKRVKHTEELLKVSEQARSKLPAVRDAFNKGLQPGEYVLVKAPFKTPGGDNEWMWVEIVSWQGDEIGGLLKNEPFDIPTLHAGQMVKVLQEDVFDYIRRSADGREEGNETAKILERMRGAVQH